MNDLQLEKLKRFANDQDVSSAVFKLLEDALLKPVNTTDVHKLAAERIAIDVLRDAWKELDKHRSRSPIEQKEGRQIGL